jgi:protein-S-isoprenylcysteine O-methyltransferase Ste14/TRAP-type uncharacterized transport system substrate-binding protein
MVRHLLAILALPFVVVVVVPVLILWPAHVWDVRWRLDSPTAFMLAGIGLALWLGGFSLTAWCIRLFALVGQGTIAPWDPTKRLVVVGPYRYVRNPMTWGVLAMLLGESLVLGSVFMLIWTALFWLVNHGYYLLSEEPELSRRFGPAYQHYRAGVPRWVPRWSAWVGAIQSLSGDTTESDGETHAVRIAEPGWLWPLLLVAVVVVGIGMTLFTVIGLLRPSPPRVYRIHLATSTIPRRVYLAEEIRKEGTRHNLEIELTSKHYGGLDALEEVNAPNEIKFALVPGGVRTRDYPNVRQVAILGTEPLHVLVRPELAAKGFTGLRGKRIALGPPSIASHHVAREVLNFVGLQPVPGLVGSYTLDSRDPEDLHRELQRINSLAEADRRQALQDLPDAVVFSAPLPSILAREFVQVGGYKLLPVPFVEAFCNDRLSPSHAEGIQVNRSLLMQTTIPAYTYSFDPAMPAEPYQTVGVPLLLVAEDDADPEAVDRLIATIYESPLKNEIRPQPLEDQVTAFPLHSGTQRYLRRHEPLLKPEHTAKIGPLLGGVGTLISGLIAFYSYMRLRKLRRFVAYYHEIGRIDMVARGLEVDPAAPTEPGALRPHLETRLTQLKHDVVEEFAKGGLQGEGLLAGLIALINDTRESLLSMEGRKVVGPDTATEPPGKPADEAAVATTNND